MAVRDSELTQAWKQVLELSNVKPGHNITILTSYETNPQNQRCALNAAHGLGAMVNTLELPPMNAERSLSRDSLAYVGKTPLTGNKSALACLKESDLVLDLMTLLFSPEQHEILESGTSILLAVEPPEILTRLVPTEEDRAMVLESSKLLQAARQMRVTSKAGTNIIFDLGQYPMLEEYGYVDKPGRWDHWPSGFLATWPNEGESNGTVVLDRGDILLPQKSYLAEPIEMTVKNGYVTNITGGLDADLLNDYMETFNDPEAYAVSHIGWGLQKRARWSTMHMLDKEAHIGMDARAFDGNFLFSMGPNTEAGGARNTACHIDIPMRNCSVYLDNKVVVENGRTVALN
ncbi:2,5-dihydroxypyridine 5,6-dioxygenase [Ruegeria sp. Ofav3-42]|uniref:2,5-dihydroxypyridine 5,6-dioxygenase n=1 Tax=Ruegeria sp. Ofav3-42 TaxID=2917759 RepID=UPI001EF660FD|nr:2,5-dihydroxypyridine 5,6-dioxygenase [Ruegeria sp. Ofav3-42]MCG7522448.1 2,5-dihydroxypyridine 5,6-dioxygenase [Ruegeria sp. Ofav3-42]